MYDGHPDVGMTCDSDRPLIITQEVVSYALRPPVSHPSVRDVPLLFNLRRLLCVVHTFPGICYQFRRFICCDSVPLVDSMVPHFADSDLDVTAVCMFSLFNYILAAEHSYEVRHF